MSSHYILSFKWVMGSQTSNYFNRVLEIPMLYQSSPSISLAMRGAVRWQFKCDNG